MDALELAVREGIAHEGEALARMRTALMENPLARPEGLEEIVGKVAALPSVRDRIKAAVERGNQKLSRVEQVKRVTLLERELSLDLDEITPTLKVKRKNLEKKFAPRFDALYENPASGIVVQAAGDA
jgi:long-chain acyl-CoA synthetase